MEQVRFCFVRLVVVHHVLSQSKGLQGIGLRWRTAFLMCSCLVKMVQRDNKQLRACEQRAYFLDSRRETLKIEP